MSTLSDMKKRASEATKKATELSGIAEKENTFEAHKNAYHAHNSAYQRHGTLADHGRGDPGGKGKGHPLFKTHDPKKWKHVDAANYHKDMMDKLSAAEEISFSMRQQSEIGIMIRQIREDYIN